ncbi:MAG: hypothetical protein ABSF67_03520 [Roseiarcus sp.]|jgi:hypothetical protein
MSNFEKYVPHAHFSVAAATVFLVVVGVWGVLETKHALESTQRAWISPISAQLNVKLEASKGIRFQVNILNSGREPAVDVNFRIQNAIIESYDPRVTDMSNITVPQNSSCSTLEPLEGRLIIPPTSQGVLFQENLDSQHGEPSLLADDKMISGSKFYVAEGCIAYKTYQSRHISSFCYIMEFDEGTANIGPNSGMIPPSVVLPVGFNIPTDHNETISVHVHNFAPCSTGFDAT